MEAAAATRSALAAAMAAVPPFRTCTDDELLAETEAWEAIGRLADAWRIAAAAEIEVRSHPSRGSEALAFSRGRKDAAALVADVARIGIREAKRRIGLGAALQSRLSITGEELPGRYPSVAAAVQAGEVGLEAARIVVETLQSVRRRAAAGDIEAAEEALTEAACEAPPELLRVHAEVWQARLDPDGAEPAEEEQNRKRSFQLGRSGQDGLTPFHGLAPAEEAALLRAALNSQRRGIHWARGTSGGEDEEDLEPDWHEAEGAERSKAQFDFDTVLSLLRAGMSASQDGKAGPTKPGQEVVVQTTLAEAEARQGSGWLEGVAARLSVPAIERIACSGGVRLLVTGERSEPLYLGQPERLFSPAQRKALLATYGGCAFPSCTAPGAWCDAHHVRWWKRDHGGTDIDNGVLLCSFHHHLIHSSGFRWEIRVHDRLPYLVPKRWQGPPEPRHRMQRHAAADLPAAPAPIVARLAPRLQ
jgi:hypothetical protein